MVDNPEIEWAVTDIKDRADRISLYRAYYDGRHRMPWSTDRWNAAFSSLFGRFRDNLCPAVVDAKADRIQLMNLSAGESDTAINTAINTIWQRERLESRQGEVTKNALKDGDAFVIVWPDEANQARWYIQRGDRMAARYSNEPQGELEIAAKLWPADEWTTTERVKWRLNLYYPDRIERYITTAEVTNGDVPTKPASWEEYQPATPAEGDDDEGRPEMRPVIDNPYGRIPIFPFPNNADLGAYGRSELHDVIPMQDALNKSVANMLVAGEFVAWPQRVLIGVEVDVDENGQPTGKEQRMALDRILTVGNPSAKVAEWAGANLQGFIAEQDSYRAEMARISRTPLHYLLLSGEFPSGEALDAAEQPLISQCNDRILTMRPAWSGAMEFALMIEGTTVEPGTVNAVFAPTKRVSPSQQAAELTLKKELGVPDEQLWREMGYDEDQIKEFTAAKEERVASMQAAFDAGSAIPNPAAAVPAE